MMPLLGAHLSTSGGYLKTFQKLADIGGTCLQTFAGSPRSWHQTTITDETKKRFRELKKEHAIPAAYFHACYLINLADPGDTGRKSITSLVNELILTAEMTVRGSIVHTGSFKNGKEEKFIGDEKYYPDLIQNIQTILAQTPQNAMLILENSGTRKIGKNLEDLATILEKINSARLKICLDTCHLHAAGYDLKTPESFEIFLKRFQDLIGINNLEVIHLNDSKDSFGSLRDRHENISEGFVGTDVFRHFLTHKKTRHLSFIIETPGFDGNGPDKDNVDRLKALI